MNVVYTKHLKHRLRQRLIPHNYPKKIYYKPELKFIDTITHSRISVKKLNYNEKMRYMMIAYTYDKMRQHVKILTIHPESEDEISNRILNGRYKLI